MLLKGGVGFSSLPHCGLCIRRQPIPFQSHGVSFFGTVCPLTIWRWAAQRLGSTGGPTAWRRTQETAAGLSCSMFFTVLKEWKCPWLQKFDFGKGKCIFFFAKHLIKISSFLRGSLFSTSCVSEWSSKTDTKHSQKLYRKSRCVKLKHTVTGRKLFTAQCVQIS